MARPHRHLGNRIVDVGVMFLGLITTYLILSSFSHRPLKVRGWVLPHLPLNLSLAQIAVTSCD